MNNKSCGFTLIELLVTLAIIGILAAAAGPFFGDTIRSNRIQASTHKLYTSLILARSEAIKRNQPVSVTKKSSGWSEGWTIEVVGGAVIQSQDLLIDNITISSDDDSVIFRPDGSISAAVVFLTCGSGSDTGRTVSLSNTGRARSEKNGDCSS